MRPPRGVLALSYLVFSLAGAFFAFWGPNLGLRNLLDWGFWVWNAFLIIGGVVGCVGAWNRLFRIEIIATPLLVAGLGIYCGYMFSRVDESAQPGVVAGLASIFLGSALLFLGKGLAIWIHKIRIANQVDRRASDAK